MKLAIKPSLKGEIMHYGSRYDGKYCAYSIDLRVIINYHYLVDSHARSSARFT